MSILSDSQQCAHEPDCYCGNMVIVPEQQMRERFDSGRELTREESRDFVNSLKQQIRDLHAVQTRLRKVEQDFLDFLRLVSTDCRPTPVIFNGECGAIYSKSDLALRAEQLLKIHDV